MAHNRRTTRSLDRQSGAPYSSRRSTPHKRPRHCKSGTIAVKSKTESKLQGARAGSLSALLLSFVW
jgi:hypothetical protein